MIEVLGSTRGRRAWIGVGAAWIGFGEMAVEAIIQRMDGEEVRSRWGPPPMVLSPLFLGRASKPRLICDLRYFNLSECPPSFSLPSFSGIRNIVPGNGKTWMSKTDMKAGWHHVLIHPSLQRYCCFFWENRIYYYTVLPFGLSSVPYCFNQLGCIVEKYLARLKIPVLLYLEDLFASHPDLETHHFQWQIITETYRWAGLCFFSSEDGSRPSKYETHSFRL